MVMVTAVDDEKYTIIRFNIRSMIEKTGLIKLMNHKIDILCISEHWLREIRLEIYKLVSYFSKSSFRISGVCIYAKNNIPK